MTRKPLINLLFTAWFFLAYQSVFSQCAVPVNSFPFTEDFEVTNGNWVTGGTSSDWKWGTPAKTVISSAGSGTKCWITGGLTNSIYNSGEASWLQSPCFDFTSLQYPYISFLVFWETERRFDGANLQYSTDLGNTWTNVGTSSDATDCLNSNWYNFSNITYLSPVAAIKEGWSGNKQNTVGSCQGGGGSAAWVTAQKCMPVLAGKKNVIFRFTFGAGTVCNSYDGFAIDKITISEAPPNKAALIYNCAGNLRIDFANSSNLCPVTKAWNFGDPASGINNTASGQSVSHTFSAPGTYSVTLTVSGPNNAPSAITQQVTVLGLTPSVLQPVTCFGGNDGAVTVSVAGAAGPFDYTWSSVPAQGDTTARGLTAGTYTVDVSTAGACPATASIQLTQPTALSNSPTVTNPGCGNTSGSISINETGGTGPYTYSWSPAVSTTASATGLSPGKYIIAVTDSHSCTDIITVNITAAIPPNVTISTVAGLACQGDKNGIALATVTGGTAPFTFSWNTNPVQQTMSAIGLAAGKYIVTVTDNNGCVDTASVVITQPINPLTATATTTGSSCALSNGQIILWPSGGTSPYRYQWSPAISNSAIAVNVPAGNYAVVVMDSSGCTVPLNNITVTNKGQAASPFLGNDTALCGSQVSVMLNPGLFSTYLWQDNSQAPTLNVTRSGNYAVTVTNSDGCRGTDNILIKIDVDCGDVFFPASFSPNGDFKNDLFGIVGNIAQVSNYRLNIFNRYGEKVFATTNPYTKWDGRVKTALPNLSAYVWYATYTFKGVAKRSQHGTVLLLR